MPNVTKTPTARNARSFTSDSNAIAATMPWWCSAASRWRVPKAMVNAARISAIHSAASSRIDDAPAFDGMVISGYWTRIAKLFETAFNCSEMYGRMPMTAMTVTRPPSSALLP